MTFAYEMYTWDPEMHDETDDSDWNHNWPCDPVENVLDYKSKFLAIKAALDAMSTWIGEHPEQDTQEMWCLIVEYDQPWMREHRGTWTAINWRDYNSVPPAVSSLS